MTLPLLEPARIGAFAMPNRIVMAPMTRSRADEHDAPGDLHIAYYAQRAGAGLIVAEGTYPHADGKGYCRTPGIATQRQIDAWRRVTDAVHRENGRIVLQLMHVGRVASRLNKAPGADTVAPSALRANGTIHADGHGQVSLDMPRALTRAEIPDVIDGFRQAAVNARTAGFDGVELHASSGYLPMQFLLACSNHRTDDYGGTPERRARFTIEALEAMAGAIGAQRVGLRICPGNPYNDMHDDDPASTYGALLDAVSPLELAYLHVSRSPDRQLDAFALAHRHFHGPLIANDGFDAHSATSVLAAGHADAVSFARHFIANPDLVVRLRDGAPLAAFDRATLYTPGERGFTDYPPLRVADAGGPSIQRSAP
ncbi:alkene reductase [Burkholderia sp. Bp9017]|uniref:Alkene reductase n=1 Tax=Burkholderia anthina TaxID=179879 RepID=A0A7T7AJK1_9BURK|nr:MULTISPECIES: alkene reductase [Burkholderia]MBY4869117.1 alkene reductase [Burkholderia anthina]QQK04722.1 alkene reductase [Burkholderia anthina]RQZ31361.1 alkene reductase [Burkholderia sp. Bp9017]RQZ37493.1 alkene reductase [Burkholderia sp. Bp9016]